MDYYSCIMTVYGGVDGKFFDEIVFPHFRERAAQARAGQSDETVWDVAADKQRLLTRWSVVLARANANLLRRALPAAETSPPPSPDNSDDSSESDSVCSVCEGEDEEDGESDSGLTMTGGQAA